MKKIFLIVAALAVCANFSFAQDCSLVSGANNLVPDGTFESLTAGDPPGDWSERPLGGFSANWSYGGYTFGPTWGNALWGQLRIINNSSQAYCGSKFAQLTNDGGEMVFPVTWEPNEIYVLRAWVNKTAGGFAFGLAGSYIDGSTMDEIKDISDVKRGVNVVDIPIPNTSGWELFECEFTTGSEAGAGNCGFHNWGSAGVLRVDNWELYKKSNVVTKIDEVIYPEFEILGTNGAITTDCKSAEKLTIYSIAGNILKQEVVSGKTTVPMLAGLYIVKLGNTVNKVLVK